MSKKKYSIFPIEHPDLWDKYQQMEAQFWKASICDFSDDEFDSLDESQQKALKMLILFFANADKVVADNLALNFLQEDIPEEAVFFYSYQLMNENIHNHTYALIIDAYIKSYEEKIKAYDAINNIPTVAKKMSWATKWITNGNFAEKLIAFACVEGLLFSSTFATIFWFKHLGKNLKGLYVANKEISSDEYRHYDFNVHYYNTYINTLSKETIRQIILEAYETESQYVNDYFGKGITGMSKALMIQYIKYITDTILINFNCQPEFNVSQPLNFMKQIAIPTRENFFEGRNAEYSSLNNALIVIDTEQDF